MDEHMDEHMEEHMDERKRMEQRSVLHAHLQEAALPFWEPAAPFECIGWLKFGPVSCNVGLPLE